MNGYHLQLRRTHLLHCTLTVDLTIGSQVTHPRMIAPRRCGSLPTVSAMKSTPAHPLGGAVRESLKAYGGTLRALLLVALWVFRHVLACALMAVLLHSRASWSESYTAQDAVSHIGEIGTVCGLVVSSKFAMRSKGQLTFLNLDRPYPNHIFTVVIWGKDRVKFGRPDLTFAGKRICVWGLIADYEGRPEMMATDPAQITFP